MTLEAQKCAPCEDLQAKLFYREVASMLQQTAGREKRGDDHGDMKPSAAGYVTAAEYWMVTCWAACLELLPAEASAGV